MSLARPGSRPASKIYTELGQRKPGEGFSSLWGAFFGIVFSTFGTMALVNSSGFGGFVFGLPFAAIGYLALLGAIGSTDVGFKDRTLTLSYKLFGVVPVFRRTLVRPDELQGVRHIRRTRSYMSQSNTRLDEHFMVLATAKAKEYVVQNLGKHSPAQAGSIAAQAESWAREHGLPLTHELDGKEDET